MTSDREPAGPDRTRRAAAHARHAQWSSRPWRRRATVVDDDDGTFLLGAASDDLLGWTATDLACTPYVELVHPDDRQLLPEAATAVRTAPTSAPFVPLDFRVLARDRRYWWTRWHVGVTTDRADVCATGVDYLGPDIASGPPVGTWRWDIDVDTVSWSTEMLDMFGFRIGPPVSYDAFIAAVFDDDRASVHRAVTATVAGGGPYVVDFRVPGRGRRERWFHAAGLLERTAAGAPRHLGGVVKYLNPPRRNGTAERPIGCG